MVLVGDTAVGKSCLIENYLHSTFSDDYEPTVLDVYKGPKNINKKRVMLEIHDTSGDEHLGTNRKVVYRGSDVFIICLAVINRTSLENVGKWKNEVQEANLNDAPIILMATKMDLRESINDAITGEEVKKKSKEMGFQGYHQTSSKEWEDFNVQKAFNNTIKVAIFNKYEGDSD